MAGRTNQLSARLVETEKRAGRYSDGGGLYLLVKPDGRKNWIWRYRSPTRRIGTPGGKSTGKIREMGLGSYPTTSLKAARAQAGAARARLAAGQDPIDAAKREVLAVPSFGALAYDLISTLEMGWRNPKHRQQWRNTIANYCAPFMDSPVDAVRTQDVLSVLKPIWQAKPETASRLRGRIERVLDAAKAQGFRDGENPARWRGHLDNLLPPRAKLSRGHHAAMPYADLPAFLERLRQRPAVAARCLEFTIITAARSGEARGARWEEVDRQNRIWTVPADRMKAARPHRVPLPDPALEILDAVAPLSRSGFVFPGQRSGAPLSDMSLSAVLKRMGAGAYTVHGFRSSFKDWAVEETDFPNELSEAALAHVTGDKVERAYRRGDVLERRRQLMKAWSDFLV